MVEESGEQLLDSKLTDLQAIQGFVVNLKRGQLKSVAGRESSCMSQSMMRPNLPVCVLREIPEITQSIQNLLLFIGRECILGCFCLFWIP